MTLVSIGSANGLSPVRHETINWTNDNFLLIRSSGTKFNESGIKIQTFSFDEVRLKMSSVKCRPFFPVSRDDVIKWKPFPRYWPFVRGIHQSPVHSTHKGQWHGALMVCKCARTNSPDAGDLRRHGAHCDITVMNMSVHKIFEILNHREICEICVDYLDKNHNPTDLT